MLWKKIGAHFSATGATDKTMQPMHKIVKGLNQSGMFTAQPQKEASNKAKGGELSDETIEHNIAVTHSQLDALVDEVKQNSFTQPTL